MEKVWGSVLSLSESINYDLLELVPTIHILSISIPPTFFSCGT